MRLGGQRHAPAALPPGMTRYPLCRRLGRSQDRSGQVLKISPPPGFDLRTVQNVARSSYSAQLLVHLLNIPVVRAVQWLRRLVAWVRSQANSCGIYGRKSDILTSDIWASDIWTSDIWTSTSARLKKQTWKNAQEEQRCLLPVRHVSTLRQTAASCRWRTRTRTRTAHSARPPKSEYDELLQWYTFLIVLACTWRKR